MASNLIEFIDSVLGLSFNEMKLSSNDSKDYIGKKLSDFNYEKILEYNGNRFSIYTMLRVISTKCEKINDSNTSKTQMDYINDVIRQVVKVCFTDKYSDLINKNLDIIIGYIKHYIKNDFISNFSYINFYISDKFRAMIYTSAINENISIFDYIFQNNKIEFFKEILSVEDNNLFKYFMDLLSSDFYLQCYMLEKYDIINVINNFILNTGNVDQVVYYNREIFLKISQYDEKNSSLCFIFREIEKFCENDLFFATVMNHIININKIIPLQEIKDLNILYTFVNVFNNIIFRLLEKAKSTKIIEKFLSVKLDYLIYKMMFSKLNNNGNTIFHVISNLNWMPYDIIGRLISTSIAGHKLSKFPFVFVIINGKGKSIIDCFLDNKIPYEYWFNIIEYFPTKFLEHKGLYEENFIDKFIASNYDEENKEFYKNILSVKVGYNIDKTTSDIDKILNEIDREPIDKEKQIEFTDVEIESILNEIDKSIEKTSSNPVGETTIKPNYGKIKVKKHIESLEKFIENRKNKLAQTPKEKRDYYYIKSRLYHIPEISKLIDEVESMKHRESFSSERIMKILESIHEQLSLNPLKTITEIMGYKIMMKYRYICKKNNLTDEAKELIGKINKMMDIFN